MNDYGDENDYQEPDYTKCVICSQPLLPKLAEYAQRSVQQMTCASVECWRKNDIRLGYLCCDQADYIPCVCARSYRCPVHAPEGVHIGTHD